MEEFLISTIKYVLMFCVIVYFTIPLYIHKSLYFPSKQFFDLDVEFEDIFIPVNDRIKINGWYSAPTTRDITVVFCHGNGGNLSFYTEKIRLLQEKGYGILAIDYRGYGMSNGSPNEKGLYEDLRAAVRYLREKKDTSEKNIVLWGLSLGGAVVAQIAMENPDFRGVILQSTFTSIRDMASHVLHRIYMNIESDYDEFYTNTFFKKYAFVNQEFKTEEKIDKINAPILLAHAIPDNIVPVEMSLRLSELNPKAEVFISQEGGHNEHSWFYPKLFGFLEKL